MLLSAAIICKNEEDVIERCITNLSKHVDEIHICDTGSTDNTISLIKELKNEKVSLHTDYTWNKNFAEARNHANSKCTGEWILSVDCDSVLNTNVNIKDFLKKVDKDVDVVRVNNVWGTREFLYPKLYKNKDYIFYKYNYHNALMGPTRSISTKDIYFSEKRVKKADQDRKDRQTDLIEYFERMNIEEPKDTRCWFYAAQTYFDNKKYDLAIKKYIKRYELGGWREEVYYSLYKIALCKTRMGMPMDEVIFDYLRAFHYRPSRLEALYCVLAYYRKKGDNINAFGYGFLGLKSARIPNKDALFVEKNIYDYAFLDELSIAAYYCGFYYLSAELIQELLYKKTSPTQDYRKRLVNNLTYSMKKIQNSASRKNIMKNIRDNVINHRK